MSVVISRSTYLVSWLRNVGFADRVSSRRRLELDADVEQEVGKQARAKRAS